MTEKVFFHGGILIQKKYSLNNLDYYRGVNIHIASICLHLTGDLMSPFTLWLKKEAEIHKTYQILSSVFNMKLNYENTKISNLF